VTDGETALVGVRDVLRRACFGNYRFEEARDAGTPQFATQRVATGLRAPHHGAARGRDVHEQLTVFVNDGRAAWQRRYGMSCSAYVERITTFLASRRLRPVVADFQDFISDAGIGSAIDLVCADEEHCGVCLIELKVGGENYFEKSNAPLNAPASLRHFSNSPRNQALLQLLVYRHMVTSNYPYVPVTRCYVLQARTDTLVLYGLTQPFIDAQSELVRALLDRLRFERARPRGAAARNARAAPPAPAPTLRRGKA